MSAFVTGGTGFIGKRLVRRLLQRDNEFGQCSRVQADARTDRGPQGVLGGRCRSRDARRRRHLEAQFWGRGQGRAQAQRQDRPFFPPRRRLRPGCGPGAGRRRERRGRRPCARLRQGDQGGLLPSCQLDCGRGALRGRIPRGHVRGGARARASLLFLEAQGRGPRARRNRHSVADLSARNCRRRTRRPARSTRSTAPTTSSSSFRRSATPCRLGSR